MGGYFALEVARRLQQRGHQVSFVALHDTDWPGHPKFTKFGQMARFARDHGGIPLDRLRRLLRVKRSDRKFPAKVVRAITENARELARWWVPNTRRQYLCWRYKNNNPPTDLELPDNVTRLWLASPRIGERYAPSFYDGVLTLFRAKVQPFGAIVSATKGWDRVSTKLEVHPVSGDHTESLFHPHVEGFAQLFAQCLEQAATADSVRH